MNTHLSSEEIFEDVPTEWEGHNFGVEQAQAYHTTNILVGVQSLRGVSGNSRGIETCFTRLIEERYFIRSRAVCV